MPFNSFSTKTLNLYGFPNFWLSVYMLKVIPETRHVYQIRYLRSVGNKDSKLRYTRYHLFSNISFYGIWHKITTFMVPFLTYKLWYVYTVVCSLSYRIRAPF
jgi:hypothetical protein